MPDSSTIDNIPEISPAEWESRMRAHMDTIDGNGACVRVNLARYGRKQTAWQQPVMDRDSGERFPSVESVAAALGTSPSNVRGCLDDPQRRCKGRRIVRDGPRVRYFLPKDA